MKKLDEIKRRVSELIDNTESAIAKGLKNIDITEEVRTVRSSSLSFIEKTYGTNHTYYKEFLECWPKGSYFNQYDDLIRAVGVMRAIKGEIDGGWLFSIKSLATAEVFSDFLEMSNYLLEEGYKDAAAVMIGGALEGHLRQLCQCNQIPINREDGGKAIPIKADALNAELTKKSVYNLTLQKQITAWLGIRNDAAHAHYDKYSKEQVRLMYEGVLSFIALNPA